MVLTQQDYAPTGSNMEPCFLELMALRDTHNGKNYRYLAMTSLAKNNKFATRASAAGGYLPSMGEPDLSAWAEQATVESSTDSPFVRLGAVAFWTVVACLLLARVFLVDASKLRPEASTGAAPHAAFHLTSIKQ
ncbi:MAG: hypothetical protein K2X60_04810 [Xanthobacteraceae bacterium]|nr:hypothetical protein [Xanthobacteraceae bacterium]